MGKKVCVVGAGYWGKNHLTTLHNLGSLYGIVDANKEIISKCQELYPDAKTYVNIEDSLFDDYQGYTIATPADTHFRIAKKLILSKKHVLIEKPMTLTIKDAEELVYLSKKMNVNVLVGHVLLFHPAIKKIKDMIDNGSIGELQYLYSNRLNLGKVRTYENVFFKSCSHDIAIFQYFTGSYPKKILSNGSAFLQKKVYMTLRSPKLNMKMISKLIFL